VAVIPDPNPNIIPDLNPNTYLYPNCMAYSTTTDPKPNPNPNPRLKP